jgi:cbb3-type cytochrome oxidase subunit 3
MTGDIFITVLKLAMTVLLILIFIGIVTWAYSNRRRNDFAAAAQLPLLADDEVLS